MIIIDRFEGSRAILEMGEDVFSLPRSLLPEGAFEGACLTIEIRLDDNAQKERQINIENIIDQLF